MRDLLQQLGTWFSTERAWDFSEAALLLLFGFGLARLTSAILSRALKTKLDPQQLRLVARITSYGIFGLAAVSALRAAGLDLSVFLGAAGILTVALGFASQTSASNLISGLFLLGERAFDVNDVIRVGSSTGEVISIDWLSVKLRTFDNLFVRIPNETLLKSEITNMTRYPIRRFDLLIGVAYREDLRRVFRVLESVAGSNPHCLDEPAPTIHFLGFGDSSIDFQFSIWSSTDRWVDFKREMAVEVKEAFDREEIEIPFPHRSIYAGSETKPLPVVLTEGTGGDPD